MDEKTVLLVLLGASIEVPFEITEVGTSGETEP